MTDKELIQHINKSNLFEQKKGFRESEFRIKKSIFEIFVNENVVTLYDSNLNKKIAIIEFTDLTFEEVESQLISECNNYIDQQVRFYNHNKQNLLRYSDKLETLKQDLLDTNLFYIQDEFFKFKNFDFKFSLELDAQYIRLKIYKKQSLFYAITFENKINISKLLRFILFRIKSSNEDVVKLLIKDNKKLKQLINANYKRT